MDKRGRVNLKYNGADQERATALKDKVKEEAKIKGVYSWESLFSHLVTFAESKEGEFINAIKSK